MNIVKQETKTLRRIQIVARALGMAKLIKIGVTNRTCQQNLSRNNAAVKSLTKINFLQLADPS